MKMKMQWHGLRLGGLTLFTLQWHEVRGYSFGLASWHNPAHMCWLWFIDAHMSVADERRAFRVFHLPGGQARTVLQLWALNIEFVWQEEGRHRNPTAHRQSRLAKLFNVKL